MNNSYKDLIEQTFDFPQKEFDVNNGKLMFNGIDMMHLIEQYGSPLKLTYLPAISENIRAVKSWFEESFRRNAYSGEYSFCYCTKANHFSFVLEEVLKEGADLEISYGFDVEIIKSLFADGKIESSCKIICNGYKTNYYKDQILSLLELGFSNVVTIIDNAEELDYFAANLKSKLMIGLRIATEEEPNFDFYTSRLGMNFTQAKALYQNKIHNNENLELKMLHFFVDTGIQDSAYYWSEFGKVLSVYGQLAKLVPSINAINIGGGLPFKDSLDFDYDFDGIIDEIVLQIKLMSEESEIAMPNIFTEFGKYTVANTGATLFKVLGSKQQNDRETWYMIDGSLISSIPDIWGIDQRYIVLPLNKWEENWQSVNIGGLSCDNEDNYNAKIHGKQLFLPIADRDSDMYLGFFHTGAYQDALSGYGGLKHCLIPSPKHVVICENDRGVVKHFQFREEQNVLPMLDILGYQ